MKVGTYVCLSLKKNRIGLHKHVGKPMHVTRINTKYLESLQLICNVNNKQFQKVHYITRNNMHCELALSYRKLQ